MFVFSGVLAGFAYLVFSPVLSDLLVLTMVLGSLVLLTVAVFKRSSPTEIIAPVRIERPRIPQRVRVRGLRPKPETDA